MKRLITATIILCVVVLLTSCGSKSIDIFQYIDVEFSGIDTQGRAYVKYSDELENALMTAAGYKDGDDPFQYLGVLLLIDAEISPNTGLTNGDKVTVKMKSNQKAFDTYKIKFTNMEKTFEVSGLQDAQAIDLLLDVDLQLESASPATQKITVSNPNGNWAKIYHDYIESIYKPVALSSPHQGSHQIIGYKTKDNFGHDYLICANKIEFRKYTEYDYPILIIEEFVYGTGISPWLTVSVINEGEIEGVLQESANKVFYDVVETQEAHTYREYTLKGTLVESFNTRPFTTEWKEIPIEEQEIKLKKALDWLKKQI